MNLKQSRMQNRKTLNLASERPNYRQFKIDADVKAAKYLPAFISAFSEKLGHPHL